MREPDNLENIIKEARNALNEIKNSQRVGNSSVLVYRTVTEDSYDFTLLSNAREKTLSLTLEYPNNLTYALLYPDVFLSTSTNVLATYTATPSYIYGRQRYLPPFTKGIINMTITVLNDSYLTVGVPTTLYGKLLITGSQPATISIGAAVTTTFGKP